MSSEQESGIESNGHGKGAKTLLRILSKVNKKNCPEKDKSPVGIEKIQPTRYKPSDLNQMAANTKFTKSKSRISDFQFRKPFNHHHFLNINIGEVRCLYRAFKQDCPNGILNEETFREVYEKIFPLGDATHYSHLVFTTIDR